MEFDGEGMLPTGRLTRSRRTYTRVWQEFVRVVARAVSEHERVPVAVLDYDPGVLLRIGPKGGEVENLIDIGVARTLHTLHTKVANERKRR